jgi:hypothetical protein
MSITVLITWLFFAPGPWNLTCDERFLCIVHGEYRTNPMTVTGMLTLGLVLASSEHWINPVIL